MNQHEIPHVLSKDGLEQKGVRRTELDQSKEAQEGRIESAVDVVDDGKVEGLLGIEESRLGRKCRIYR